MQKHQLGFFRSSLINMYLNNPTTLLKPLVDGALAGLWITGHRLLHYKREVQLMLDKCATLFVISKLATTRKKLLWCTHDIGKTSMHILSSKTELISSICMCWDMIISLFFCLFFLGKSSQKVCLSMLQEKRLQPTFSLRTRLFHLQQVSVRAQEG